MCRLQIFCARDILLSIYKSFCSPNLKSKYWELRLINLRGVVSIRMVILSHRFENYMPFREFSIEIQDDDDDDELHLYSAFFHMDMFKCALHQVLCLRCYILYPNPPANLPCGRKPECPEKTHDFRQSVGILFSHEKFEESWWRIEPTSQRWKALVLTTAPPKPLETAIFSRKFVSIVK